MLEIFIYDRIDGHTRLPSILCVPLQSASYDNLPFLTWSWLSREAERYEAKHRFSSDEAYLVSWHNREFLMILCQNVPSCRPSCRSSWRQYEPCRGLLVATRPLLSFVSSLFIIDSPPTEALYCAARTDHCVIVIIAFLQWVIPMDAFIDMNVVGHNSRVQENINEGVLYPFLGRMVRLVMTPGVHNIAARPEIHPCLSTLHFFALRRLLG